MRSSLLLAGLAAAALVVTAASPARASGDGEAIIAVGALALFDVISLPADIVMAANHTQVPHDYAMAELIAGTTQAGLFGIGSGICFADRTCRGEAAFPLLIAMTAWTTAMAFHGGFSLDSGRHKHASGRPPSPSFAFAPMVGDGKTTPAGVGFVGSF